MMDRQKTSSKNKSLYLICSILICFSFLFFFKYFNFASEIASGIAGAVGLNLHPKTLAIAQPAGISFYTFMTVSYLVDVYKGKIKAESNFAKLSLYVSFFPQIIAGPIGRAPQLLGQFFEKRDFDAAKAESGLRLIMWGYFKKLIIADSLSAYVDSIYSSVYDYFGMTFIITSLMYTMQIYCDFSGYSDIAIGVARLFNIDLMENFKSPYFSRSIKEFWSRWHISLSTWFRDYVYIPLGGSRHGELKKNRNILLTMLASGLWHGANWTFIVWGGLHGIYQVIEGLFWTRSGEKKDRQTGVASNVIHWALTFILVDIAWIFFRADNFSDAFYVVSHLHSGVILHFAAAWTRMLTDFGITGLDLLKLTAPVILLVIYDFISLKKDISTEFSKVPLLVRWPIYIALTVWVVTTQLNGGTTQSFIYFTF
ncbi:MBOAT family O-acyltransferase [Butyrivibrio sp. CB08]|uniref:MBOAT family O-acyltransferase n=1 Tax=Butyrivibrio sp. CB08 TaxID=2364879 RepID=UPI001314A4D6|nr:MBOAT family O-acyltransferase [Butyrivibrio sp. CB08]